MGGIGVGILGKYLNYTRIANCGSRRRKVLPLVCRGTTLSSPWRCKSRACRKGFRRWHCELYRLIESKENRCSALRVVFVVVVEKCTRRKFARATNNPSAIIHRQEKEQRQSVQWNGEQMVAVLLADYFAFVFTAFRSELFRLFVGRSFVYARVYYFPFQRCTHFKRKRFPFESVEC